jgi:hypothetical protein
MRSRGSAPGPELGDLGGGDRAVRSEVDAVADRVHPAAQRAVADAGERPDGLGGEPAEPLAELVGHRDHVVHQPARHLVAQRLAAAAVDQLLGQELVRAIGDLAGERAERADRRVDPAQPRGQPGVQQRPRVDRVDDVDVQAAQQLGELPHAVGP